MTIQLQRENSRPLYLQIADQLRLKIESGELAPNTRLPASRVLAKQLGVNRITVVNAYAEVEAEGLVMSRMGSGTFVAPVQNSPTLAAVESPLPWRGSMPLRRQWNANQMLAEMMRLARQPGVISFAGGGPASEFLPVNEFRRALNEVLRRDGADALQYQEASGYHPLKQLIANYLKQQNIQVKAEDILITTGCQQALDLVLRVLVPGEPGVILVEDPCYLGLLDLVAAQRITPVGIPLDEHGLRIERLESMILRHRPQLIYITPTFQNPTGVTMPLERRQALLDLAARYGVPILEDTTYDELRYEGQTQPTLKSLDPADIVLHASGFSKILVPGIRIGYLVVPPILHDRLLAAKQTVDILTSPLNQRALHAYLQSGHFPKHLQQVRRAYKIRLDTMLAAIEQHFPQEAHWRAPQGGMYTWVEMPADGPTATNLYLTAINYNVAFAIGSVFSASGSAAHAMRLNFTNRTPNEIEEGIRRLGKAWKELLARQTGAPSQSTQRTTMHIL
jgi:DNA-binding transcriptional MocR family regulator